MGRGPSLAVTTSRANNQGDQVKRIRTVFQLCCALLGWVTMAHAGATETASATLSDFRVQVVSLAPGGGTVSLAGGNVSYYSFNGVSYNNHAVDGPIGAALGITFPGDLSMSGFASIAAGDPFAATGGPSAYTSASATAPGTYLQTAAYLMVGQFTIGPNTQLILTANASASIAAAPLNANDFAAATIQISDATGANLITWDYSLIYSEFDGRVFDYRKPTLQVVLTNTTDADITRYAFVSARSSVVMAAVPEPSTYAQLLLGVCCLGFLAVRRQAARRAH